MTHKEPATGTIPVLDRAATGIRLPELAPFALWPVLAVSVALLALELAFSSRYGFHRDELYFMDAGRHLQGGYVDQPIGVPLLARISLSLFGVSATGLRIWPALSVAVTVVVGALLARELGGGRRAQVMGAVGTATMPALLAIGAVLQPTTFDILFWSLFALLVVRIGRTGYTRYWLPAGVVVGLGLATKHSVGFFVAATVLGILLTGGRRLIFNRWALAGLIIAGCFTIPDLWWQAQHNWPTIAMTKSLNEENGGLGNAINWVIGQLLMVNVAFYATCVAGGKLLWRSGDPTRRALVFAYGLLFVVFMATTGGKIYYLAAAYVYLIAGGAVATEQWWAAHMNRMRAKLALAGVLTVLVLPVVLPVLPPSDIGGFAKLNTVQIEELGWPQLVHTVRKVWFSLPARARANAVIFTSNYGEAGAINELGRGSGLPIAVSGHNNEWFWGPGDPNATTVVAVAPGPQDVGAGEERSYLAGFFRHVRVAATLRNPENIHNQEWGGHAYVCTGLYHRWASMWPRLRQYS